MNKKNLTFLVNKYDLFEAAFSEAKIIIKSTLRDMLLLQITEWNS